MSETIGQQLKEAREAKNLTIQKVVQATHIRAYQIEAMEADDFESMPSAVQARAFLRLYAEFLGLSLDAIIARQRAVAGETPVIPATQALVPTGETAPEAETEIEVAALKTQHFGDNLTGLQKRIKGIFLRQKMPSTTTESVAQTPATPSIPAPAIEGPAATTLETITKHSPVKGQPVVDNLNKLLTVIKRVARSSKKPIPPLEPADQPPTVPTIFTITPVEKAMPADPETGTEPSQMESQPVGNKLKGILARIRGGVLHQKRSSMLMEPVEDSNLLEPFETDGEEPRSYIEEIPFPAPEENSAPAPEEKPTTAPYSLPSQSIFIAIGKTLRQRRDSLSLTLDEIERHTHVRKHYLQALESGEFERLPSSVQARGMLNNYARFLDLDVDALLLTFAEGLQTQRLERQPRLDGTPRRLVLNSPFITSQPFKIKIPAFIQRYFSVDILVGGGLVLLLLTFAIWGTSRILNLRAGSTPQPTAPSILNILVSTPEEATSTPTSLETTSGASLVSPVAGETLVLTIPAADLGPVQVVLVALEQAWVRVIVDGKIQFEGRVTAGTAYSYDGNTQIEVLTGNGRAISILYNQNDLGPMGNIGEVVDHIYTANAILNPTATFTLTPTITKTSTVTLRPTITPRPSVTPRPSATPRSSPTPSK